MENRPILSVEAIHVTYSEIIPALRGVSLRVPDGAIVALLGANGAGKSTTLKTISRLVHAERGALTAGRVLYRDQDVATTAPWSLAARGLVQVLEGRRCFAHLSVEENLRLAAFVRRASNREIATALERVFTLFPRLRTRRDSLTGFISGGEQQMVAIGRALMAQPSLILLDEPSMGLAPKIIEEIFEAVVRLNREEGVSFLLAEQNAVTALRHASHGYVLDAGKVVAEGPAATLLNVEAVRIAYLGSAMSGNREMTPRAVRRAVETSV